MFNLKSLEENNSFKQQTTPHRWKNQSTPHNSCLSCSFLSWSSRWSGGLKVVPSSHSHSGTDLPQRSILLNFSANLWSGTKVTPSAQLQLFGSNPAPHALFGLWRYSCSTFMKRLSSSAAVRRQREANTRQDVILCNSIFILLQTSVLSTVLLVV